MRRRAFAFAVTQKNGRPRKAALIESKKDEVDLLLSLAPTEQAQSSDAGTEQKQSGRLGGLLVDRIGQDGNRRASTRSTVSAGRGDILEYTDLVNPGEVDAVS